MSQAGRLLELLVMRLYLRKLHLHRIPILLVRPVKILVLSLLVDQLPFDDTKLGPLLL